MVLLEHWYHWMKMQSNPYQKLLSLLISKCGPGSGSQPRILFTTYIMHTELFSKNCWFFSAIFRENFWQSFWIFLLGLLEIQKFLNYLILAFCLAFSRQTNCRNSKILLLSEHSAEPYISILIVPLKNSRHLLPVPTLSTISRIQILRRRKQKGKFFGKNRWNRDKQRISRV